MRSEDARLIQQIQRITHGGARLLVTLARRGKALERSEPERASSLLEAVLTHPLYKGGRLTFDMLEIEDLMLDGPHVVPMSRSELIGVFDSGAYRVGDMLKRMGSEGRVDEGAPEETTRHEAESLDGAGEQSVDEPVDADALPRLSLGPEFESPRGSVAAAPGGDDSDAQDLPELQSSDYLYGYVVLGWLDVARDIDAFRP